MCRPIRPPRGGAPVVGSDGGTDCGRDVESNSGNLLGWTSVREKIRSDLHPPRSQPGSHTAPEEKANLAGIALGECYRGPVGWPRSLDCSDNLDPLHVAGGPPNYS